jgi:hypothetical protein
MSSSFFFSLFKRSMYVCTMMVNDTASPQGHSPNETEGGEDKHVAVCPGMFQLSWWVTLCPYKWQFLPMPVFINCSYPNANLAVSNLGSVPDAIIVPFLAPLPHYS